MANWTTSSSPNLDSLQQLLFSNWYDNDRFIFSRYTSLYWPSQLKGEFYQTCRNIYEVIRNSYFENESQFFWDSKFTWTVNKSLKPFWSINSDFQTVHRLFFKYIFIKLSINQKWPSLNALILCWIILIFNFSTKVLLLRWCNTDCTVDIKLQ